MLTVMLTTGNKDYLVSTPHPYLSGPASELQSAIVGYATDDHYVVVSLNGNQVWSGTYPGFSVDQFDQTGISSSWLTGPTSTLTYSSAASPSAADWNGVAWFDFKYPREFDFDNSNSLLFSLPSNNANQYLEISDFNEEGTTPILYDFTNKLRLQAVVQGDTEKFLLPSSLQPERQLLLTANDLFAIKNVDSLWTVHFVDYSNPANQGNFIIISHPFFFSDSATEIIMLNSTGNGKTQPVIRRSQLTY